ncbi:MAG: type I polyketide synthase [Coprococcus sp.]|nr:type I polyketide synthase [Coprococcus sp.]
MDYSKFDIAIIGMDCEFPQINSIPEFWKAIKNGEEKVSYFTDDELREAGVSEEALANPSYRKMGYYLEDATKFDSKFFGYLPREAQLIDPQQRKFLECCWNAMEDAGYVAEKSTTRVGVFGGSNLNTYLLANILDGSSIEELGDRYGDQQIMIGNDKDYITTRVSFKLNIDGPSVNVQAACATSLYAVHFACEQILSGACEMAIAGGSSIRFPHKTGYYYKEGGTFSKDGHIYSYDEKAHGSMSGYGAGAVVLKPVFKAIEDKDHIYAVIKGTAVNNDGGSKSSFTAPNVHHQAITFKEAADIANVPMESITYIEGHGAGTKMGDPIEVEGFRTAFHMANVPADLPYKCVIGSAKPNIGHCDAAAGIAGLIKTALCLKNQTLPPLVHFEKLNSEICIDGTNFAFINKAQKWEIEGYPLRASVNSLGMGGHNANVILEEPPRFNYSQKDDNKLKMINISAKSMNSLNAMQSNLYNAIQNNSELHIKDVEYTLHMGRKEFEFRKSFVCATMEELLEQLKSNTSDVKEIGRQKRKNVVLLSPNDVKFLPHLKEFYDNVPMMKDAIDKLKPILNTKITTVLDKLLNGNQPVSTQLLTEMKEVEVTLLFVFYYAIISYLIGIGLKLNDIIGSALSKAVEDCINDSSAIEGTLRDLQNASQTAGSEGNGVNAEVLNQKYGVGMSQYLFIGIGSIAYDQSALFNSDGNAYVGLVQDENASADEILIRFIAQLWQQGAMIDWSKYHNNQVFNRISLPTYPFEKKEMEYRNKEKQVVKKTVEQELEVPKEPVATSEKKAIDNQKVEEDIISLIEDITGSKLECMEEDVSAIGMTSMQYAQFATRINDKYNTDLNKAYFGEVESINGIIEIVEGKLE